MKIQQPHPKWQFQSYRNKLLGLVLACFPLAEIIPSLFQKAVSFYFFQKENEHEIFSRISFFIWKWEVQATSQEDNYPPSFLLDMQVNETSLLALCTHLQTIPSPLLLIWHFHGLAYLSLRLHEGLQPNYQDNIITSWSILQSSSNSNSSNYSSSSSLNSLSIFWNYHGWFKISRH